MEPKPGHCWHCHERVEGRRINAQYCSDEHQRKGARRRAQGLPVDAFNGENGGRRGRLRLSEPTKDAKVQRLVAAAYDEGQRAMARRLQPKSDADAMTIRTLKAALTRKEQP